MLSFAGVTLPAITADIAATVAAKISPWDIFDFQKFHWPGARRQRWTFPGMLRDRGVRLGSLYWPRDASRWAVGYFLATTANLQQIRSQLQGSASQLNGVNPATGNAIVYGPGSLLISEENQNFETVGKISATMWMLPARPLLDITKQNGLYLITLVDDRFWWWFRDSGVISIDEGETTWEDLFDQIAQALGTDIDYDEIATEYLVPGAGLAAQYEQLPLLLDAVAFNCGQRICIDLDGTVHSYSQEESQNIFGQTVSLLAADAPGTMYMEGGGFISSLDKPSLLPSAVRVTFPRSVGYVALGEDYEVTVTLAYLYSEVGITEVGSIGNGNVKTFHDTCGAEGPTAETPINHTELSDLAIQIASDWYLYQLGSLDAKFEGIVNWTIEGLSDCVEWMYVDGDISTRVMRPAWNDLTEELLHGPSPVDPPAWIKVTGPAQTITLTSSGTRSISGSIFTGERILLNANGDFTDDDLGSSVSGTGIPANTTILTVEGSSQATMSNAATGTLQAITVSVTDTGKTTQGCPGVVEKFIDYENQWLYWDQQHQEWAVDNGNIDWSTVESSVWAVGANGESLTLNVRYNCSLLGEDDDGVPIFAPPHIPGLAYVQPTTTTPSQIILGRTITDAVLNGTTTLVSPQQASFTTKDVGAVLVGTGIAGGTTILSISSSTTVVMSASATAGTNVTVEIQTGSKKGYAAVVNFQDATCGSWKRRTITDVTLTNLSTTLTSSVQGAFTLGDDGATLTNADIPNGTTATLFNATTLTMSNQATGNATNATVVITQGTLQECWFIEGNDSVWYSVSGSPPPPQPVSIPIATSANYQCRFFQNDVSGVAIYEVVEMPHAIIAELTTSTPNGDGLYTGNQDLYDPAAQAHSAGIAVWLRDANS